MIKPKYLVVGILSILLILALILGGFLYKKANPDVIRKPDSDLVEFSNNPKKGEPGYKETNTTVSTSQEGRYSGNFKKIADGRIYITYDQDQKADYLLNEQEIAVDCTQELLTNVKGIDLSKVNNVLVIKSQQDLSNLIPVDTPIFLIASTVNNEIKVHTVVVPDSVCSSQ